MRLLRIALLLTPLLSPWMHAQDRSAFPSGRWEIYGGPAFTGSNPSGATYGFGVGVASHFTHWLGAAGDFTLVQTTCCVVNHIVLTDYLFGPRVQLPFARTGKLTPFVDVLFGGQTLNNSSSHHSWYYTTGSGPAIAADGGLNVRLTGRLSIRGNAGYLYSHFAVAGMPSVSNSRWRAGTSLVFRF